jgi:hypothetical protein
VSVVVVTPATNTMLTTIDAVKRELGITVDTDDLTIVEMVKRASSAIARECRRVFGIETVTETIDGTGTRLLGLSRTPILSVSAVTEDSTAITDYSIEDAEAGALYRANGWGRSGGLRMWGTEAFSSGYILPGYQDRRYSVTYQAGYLLPGEASSTLPGAVEQACLETVKAWYSQRDVDPTMASVKVGQFQVSYRSPSEAEQRGALPSAALSLLANYYAMPLV